MPTPGLLAKDTSTGSVGRVMGRNGPFILMRPLKGGLEWEVLPEDVEEITTGAALSVAVAEDARQREAYRGFPGWFSGACL
jgi:hypothetical protein